MVLACVFAGAPSADAQDEEEETDGPSIEQAGFRFAVFEQEGLGVQSQANTQTSARGSEHAWIFQPMAQIQVRQDRNATHNIAIPIDIVTAASTDALDAITSESRENEAGGADVVTTVRDNDHTSYQLHIGFHFEEYWGSGSLGAAVIESFADDNATFRAGVEVIHDSFDALEPSGRDPGPVVSRFTSNVNASISQLLSPTTIVSATYSFTTQFGHLETTYNSIPTATGERVADRYPRQRGRHALGGEIRQAIPESQTYLGLSYRFYADSFGASAHTTQATVTQYLGDLWLRGHYRFHYQDAPSFWMAEAPLGLPSWAPRTADSDLETLHAHELGLNARWFFDRHGALTWNSSFIQVGYLYYWRSNSLQSHVANVEIGLGFP
ncbi:MAG: DUF3570 domain-containing protein [Sandaracinaceae bacterium]|nr:DUF3570 domain-containing protein [Sandaracinaceae bacterium]